MKKLSELTLTELLLIKIYIEIKNNLLFKSGDAETYTDNCIKAIFLSIEIENRIAKITFP